MASLINKNLLRFQRNIANVINIFLIISSVIFVVFYLFIYFIDRRENINSYKELVMNTNKVLQLNLSTELVIIANDPNFISYLRAGEITRKKYYNIMRWAFSNLDHRLIKGVSITAKESNAEIFSYGMNTNLYTKLDLCYLGNQINSKLGDCNNFIVIYFDKSEYVKQLHYLDNRINPGTKNNSYLYNPITTSFGIFNSPKHSVVNLNLAINYANQLLLFISIAFTLLLFAVVFIFSHRYIKSIIEKDIVLPIKNITDSLHDGKTLLLKQDDLLVELNELIDVVNKYNSQQINSKLYEVAGSVAHDLNGPINGVRAIMPKIKANSNKTVELDLLDNYINRIHSIASDVLKYFRDTSEEFLVDDLNLPRFLILEDIIDEIIQSNDKWLQNGFNLIFTREAAYSWIYSSPIKLYRSLANLLDNAYESLTNQIKNITVTTSHQKDNVLLIIEDTGCGIPSGDIHNVLYGKSFKHKGKGLGLSSASEYFSAIGGKLEIESQQNTGTKIIIQIPKLVPKWFTDKIFYNDNTIFIVIEENVDILAQLQKLFLSMYNKKLYFTCINSFEMWRKESALVNAVLVIGSNLYSKLIEIKEIIIESTLQIFIITETVINYEVPINAKIIPPKLLGKILIEHQ